MNMATENGPKDMRVVFASLLSPLPPRLCCHQSCVNSIPLPPHITMLSASLSVLFSLFSLTSSLAVRQSPYTGDLTIQAGRHVMYSYAGVHPDPELISLISAGKVGGVLIFGNNVDANISTHLATYQSAFASSPAYDGHSLLIVTDQEGGKVRRLPGGPTLSEKAIGASADPIGAARTAGQQAANALLGAGVNGNLSPVLDVFRTAGDFDDQYGRSYSDNATLAGQCGAAFTQVLQRNGLLATAKHFPGLGTAAAGQNTDEEPVTLDVSLEELRNIDEAAFVDAIAAGLDMVMPSWALYPNLDAEFPSGLSSKVLQGELRERLGFQGVTISDAIGAGGLVNFGSVLGHRAVLAVQAGMDIILSSSTNQTVNEGIVDALVEAVQNGTIDANAWAASTQRISDLRARLN